MYEPQALHTLCGSINSPHLLHLTKFGAVIFQFALRLSLLPLDDLLKQVRMIRLTVSGKIFYYIKWIMSKIPTHIAVFILIYFILIFYKLWLIYPIRKDESI